MNIWREYSINYIKNNKASTVSVMVAALIASILLSLTCGIFYNMWADELRLTRLEEGDWHGKLAGSISDEDAGIIESHPNVKSLVIEEAEDGEDRTAIIRFYHPGRIYKDLPQIAERIGLDTEEDKAGIIYHSTLLAKYFIFSKANGNQPPLILFVYLFIVITACISLVLIINNAFGVSMNARIYQLGILKSIGVGPRRIRSALTKEAVSLCLLPIIVGAAAGTGLCYAFFRFIEKVVSPVREYEPVFAYHPGIFLAAVIVSYITVWFSARLPAKKMSRISPLEAIRYGTQQPVKKVKGFFLVSHLFGIEGELARKSLYIRRKAFRTATLSLTLSFLAFSIFLNMEKLSGISTKYTFFERYKDTWDLMLSIQDIEDGQEELLDNLRAVPGVKKCISYQVDEAYTLITKEMFSDELVTAGGLDSFKDTGIKEKEGLYSIKAPVIVLDEESFRDYCRDNNIDADSFASDKQPGVILINTIWNSTSSNRRNKDMIPFLNIGTSQDLLFYQDKGTGSQGFETLPVRVAAAADKLPDIREGFQDFSLIQVMSADTYQQAVKSSKDLECKFNITADSENYISGIESDIKNILKDQYKYILENKLETVRSNGTIRRAYRIVISLLSGLLVCIGLANVFANTLGHIYQRKREFARYITIGMTPKGVRKVFTLEALLLGLKPVVTGLLINIPLVGYGIHASLIPPEEYFKQMPVLPIAVFALVMTGSVVLAYYIGGRKMAKTNFLNTLKDDTFI